MCVQIFPGNMAVRMRERTSSAIRSRALDWYDLARSSDCSMARDTSCLFHCSRIKNATQQRPVSCPPSAGQKLFKSFRQPDRRVVFCTMSNALLFRTSACGLISTESGLASMSFKVGLSCCAAPSSVSLDDVNTVAAMFLSLNVRSFHDAAVGVNSSITSKLLRTRWKIGEVLTQVPLSSPLPLLRS